MPMNPAQAGRRNEAEMHSEAGVKKIIEQNLKNPFRDRYEKNSHSDSLQKNAE
jgi:hypothetical protein